MLKERRNLRSPDAPEEASPHRRSLDGWSAVSLERRHRTQEDPPTHAEAIRQLMEMGLASEAKQLAKEDMRAALAVEGKKRGS